MNRLGPKLRVSIRVLRVLLGIVSSKRLSCRMILLMLIRLVRGSRVRVCLREDLSIVRVVIMGRFVCVRVVLRVSLVWFILTMLACR